MGLVIIKLFQNPNFHIRVSVKSIEPQTKWFCPILDNTVGKKISLIYFDYYFGHIIIMLKALLIVYFCLVNEVRSCCDILINNYSPK